MHERVKCIACERLGPKTFSHWWDINDTAGWVCGTCHARAEKTYRTIRRRLRDGLIEAAPAHREEAEPLPETDFEVF